MVKKLEAESKEIAELLQSREKCYDEFIQNSAAPYAITNSASSHHSEVNESTKGFFSSVSSMFTSK